jgi:hypothetical protein
MALLVLAPRARKEGAEPHASAAEAGRPLGRALAAKLREALSGGDAARAHALASGASRCGQLAWLRQGLEEADAADSPVPALALAALAGCSAAGEHAGAWVAQMADALLLGDEWVAAASRAACVSGNVSLAMQLSRYTAAAAAATRGERREPVPLAELLAEEERRTRQVFFAHAERLVARVRV